MTTFNEILSVTPRSHVAMLSPVPRLEDMPAPSNNPAIRQVLGELATLHYAAHVTLYGPAPDRVHVRRASVRDNGVDNPTYLATLGPAYDAASVEWFHAFEAGLTKWRQACFPDPLLRYAGDHPHTHRIKVVETSSVIEIVTKRLQRLERHQHLANLLRILPDMIDPNPGSPA